MHGGKLSSKKPQIISKHYYVFFLDDDFSSLFSDTAERVLLKVHSAMLLCQWFSIK